MASPKRKALTLQERVEVIKMNESGKSARAIAEHFKVGKTQIQSTIKRKAEVLSDFEMSAPLSKRRNVRATGNTEINDLTLKWFLDATGRKINVNGPMIKEKALQFSVELNVDTFSASNGWLESFVKREVTQREMVIPVMTSDLHLYIATTCP
jgi:predicted DNA-binding protein YlxM (UPF0122 family)